jgi:hypothetical protein
VTSSQLAQARATAGTLPFTLEFPRVQDSNGFSSGTPVTLRNYLIHAPNGTAYPAYIAVFSAGLLGQYYDVQGMTWTGAPMFSSPDQTVSVGGRTYSLYYSGQHLQVVAWFEHGAAYWVHNSLTDAIGNGELLAIAEQTIAAGTPGHLATPIAGRGAKGNARLKAAFVPGRVEQTAKTSTLQTVGSIGGLVTLVAAPLLIIALVRRRRRLSSLRMNLNTTLALESNLRVAMSGRLREWIEGAGPANGNGGNGEAGEPVGVGDPGSDVGPGG